MKKVFIATALILSSFFAFSAENPQIDTTYVRVKNIEQIGTNAEKAAESKLRKALYAEKIAKGHTFLGVFQNPAKQKPGKYLVFLKSK